LIKAVNNKNIFVLTNNKFLINNFKDSNVPLSKIIFIPLPSLLLEQLIIPIIIKLYSIEQYITDGNSSSFLRSFLCKTTLIIHDIYFTSAFGANEASLKRIIGKFYRRFMNKLNIHRI
jgi:hypothetical protein